jgi:hypothetical protein
MKTVVIAVAALMFVIASADDLYEQRPHTPGATGGNGLSNFAGDLGAPPVSYDRRVADDFTVPQDEAWCVSHITTRGVWFSTAAESPVSALRVTFYKKVSNMPSEDVWVEAATANLARSNGPGVYFARTERVLEADLSTVGPVRLAPGEYYVMVHPMGTNDNWFQLTSQEAGAPPATRGTQVFLRGGQWAGGVVYDTWQPGTVVFGAAGVYDLAFKLSGEAVPMGDVNCDGCVDDADLLAVLFAFGSTGNGMAEDLNGDGVVDDADLLIVLFGFGEGCGG